MTHSYRRHLKSLQTASERYEMEGDLISLLMVVVSEFAPGQTDFVLDKIDEITARVRADHGDRQAVSEASATPQ